MRHAGYFASRTPWTSVLRCGMEYTAAIGLALLLGYWIVEVRW